MPLELFFCTKRHLFAGERFAAAVSCCAGPSAGAEPRLPQLLLLRAGAHLQAPPARVPPALVPGERREKQSVGARTPFAHYTVTWELILKYALSYL